jgi:hypothetical protein
MEPASAMISLDRLRELFTYDPDTGVLTRLSTGKPCGSPNGNGYLRVNIQGTMEYAHRIAFALHHGYVPDTVDHRDHVRTNNRAYNLRDCSKHQNNKSKSKRSNARTSDFIGVSFDTQTGRWRAQITVNGKHVSIGRFDEEETAAHAYDEAARKYNGEFAKTNYGTATVSNDHP